MEKTNGFDSLGLSENALKAVTRKGFTIPSPIQAATIPLLLNETMDIVGQAQTGTGKTAAFGLPIIDLISDKAKHVQCMILTPTRELCMQVAKELDTLKGNKRINVTAVYGGQSINSQMNELRRGSAIVVGTPGRVMDLMDRGALNLKRIDFFVLDEAD
jgi:ATP-dependent RNA helicase DeaD